MFWPEPAADHGARQASQRAAAKMARRDIIGRVQEGVGRHGQEQQAA